MHRSKEEKPARPFIDGFIALSPTIFLQDANYPLPPLSGQQQQQQQQLSLPQPTPPTAHSEVTPASSPDLIILASWTGALAKHISKYTLSYNYLFPASPILLLTTSISDLAFHTSAHKLARLAPALTYLTATAPRTILLHAFSEGGAHKSVLLARAFLAQTAAPLPVAAFVFDSAPGTPRYTSNVAAFRRSLPRHAAARALGVPVGAAVLGVTWVLFSVFVGYENNLISKTRRALNDVGLWGEGLGSVPRAYLFSERDDLIWWRDVEAHGVEAAEGLGGRCLMMGEE
ncbi:hypothetical protein B0T18DRAFT_389624 [Schizothecium vesticola]|uniref:Indole-diterpene biosynthesis protein PaxU n=1 Tax=Schizothecium vesticola TaxID=314040 RepID=A0AA40K8T2_9PEZI|nr:hypothetical protein B0T18DRAFT_389624 [Schizothecium vesticola]